MDTIFMDGLTFYGYHGVFPEETQLGQRFVVSLRMMCDTTRASRSDDLQDTVDYGKVYNIVEQIVQGEPYRLVETVAERIAGRVLDAHPSVSKVSVRLEKPQAPVRGVFASVGVEIERNRGKDSETGS